MDNQKGQKLSDKSSQNITLTNKLKQKKEQQNEMEIQEKKMRDNEENKMELEEQSKQQEQEQEDEEVEIEVVYVPIDYNLFVTQYPLRNKENKEFEEYVQPVNCEYKSIQKQLKINYLKTDKFTNLRQDYFQQEQKLNSDFMLGNKNDNTSEQFNKKLAEQMKEQQDQNQGDGYTVSYVSKLLHNKTNYFVSHYDKTENKIYMFPVNQFLQMRPLIKGGKALVQTSKKGQTGIDLKKQMDRDTMLLEKYPDKYLENRLKTWTTYQDILQSEEFEQYQYRDISNKRRSRSEGKQRGAYNLDNNPLSNLPGDIIDLKHCSKADYVKKLEEK